MRISDKERAKLLEILKSRFKTNEQRHDSLEWDEIQEKLIADPSKLWSLNKMEETGGEPDVVGYDEATGEFIFMDCSTESPSGRRSLCYDQAALETRKEHKPKSSAMEMAASLAIEILTESEYRELQKLGEFDTKTSSWIKTSAEIRKLGGAVFCVSQRC